jgi:AcrR family transcriptional regulator
MFPTALSSWTFCPVDRVDRAKERGGVSVSRGRQKSITSRAARREERRRVVLDAAESLISREGLPGFSMRLLAHEAGMPTPTLYGYFASKEAVLESLADEKISLLQEHILREGESAAPGMARLIAFARGYRRFALEDTDFYDLFVSRSSIFASKDLRDMAMVPGTALIRMLAHDVRVAIDQREIGPVDPERTIIGLWAMAQGYLSLELRDVLPATVIPPDEREDVYLQYVDAVLRGMETGSEASNARAKGE